MDNKTPPAWATLAANRINSGMPDEDAFIISDCAPNAEALAEALEEALEEMKSWQIDWERMADDNAYTPSFSEPTNQAISALSAYRARFPKVTP